jgi:hypothetical protein
MRHIMRAGQSRIFCLRFRLNRITVNRASTFPRFTI